MEEKPKRKIPRFTLEELEYIRDNALVRSDDAIAKHLGRDIDSVRLNRRKLGIIKGESGKLKGYEVNGRVRKIEDIDIELPASQRLTEQQRKAFYQKQFESSLYYKNLTEQFTTEEIDFYLEEWGSLSLQFEDIVATEKRQIDEFIKISIMGNRILRNIKVAEEEIKKLQTEIEDFRKANPKLDEDEKAQERDVMLMGMVRTMAAQSGAMAKDYQQNIDMKNKLLNELNARRKDRVDQLTKRNTTFLGLVTAFREKEVRANQGRHMELVKLAKEKKKAEWRQPTTFPDGTRDCILLDEHSEIPQTETILLKNMGSRLVDQYAQKENAKILVVEDDDRRNQFFAEIFRGNKLQFATNISKAVESLKAEPYDLICLDYDLGLDDKGAELIDYMNENNIGLNTDILVQSMNKEGVEVIKSKINVVRNLEVVPFEEILQTFGVKDAENRVDA